MGNKQGHINRQDNQDQGFKLKNELKSNSSTSSTSSKVMNMKSIPKVQAPSAYQLRSSIKTNTTKPNQLPPLETSDAVCLNFETYVKTISSRIQINSDLSCSNLQDHIALVQKMDTCKGQVNMNNFDLQKDPSSKKPKLNVNDSYCFAVKDSQII